MYDRGRVEEAWVHTESALDASRLHSPDFYAGDPYPAYRELRATAPVCWNDVTNFWALLKYEDIRYVSSNPATFTSTEGITIPDPAMPSPVQPGSLIFTDPPRHRQMRKLINSGFTRRRVSVLEPKIREIVRGILDDVGTRFDARVRRGDRRSAADPADRRVDRRAARRLGAVPGLVGRGHRQRRPGDRTRPVRGRRPAVRVLPEADRRRGESSRATTCCRSWPAPRSTATRLTDEDLLNFAFLLLVAGNETTRNLIALGTLALIAHPDQYRLLVDDPALIPGAVEEMLRWNSPVIHMARTATADVEIRGQHIAEGDVVVMLYGSANRDEEIFGADSEEFKITRHPNPHIAFGCGEHSCIGAQLARLEATVMFEELLRPLPAARTGRRRRPDAGDHGARRQADAGTAGGLTGAIWTTRRNREQLRDEIRATLER